MQIFDIDRLSRPSSSAAASDVQSGASMIAAIAVAIMENEKPSSPVWRAFERVLLSARYLVIIAVASSLLVGLAMFIVATVDAAMLVVPVATYPFAHVAADHHDMRNHIVRSIVEVVDGYLLAAAMLIFAMGLYTLFIAPISAGEQSGIPGGALTIRTFDDLKDRLAKVVLLILIVKFFEHALEMSIDRPLDLLYMAVAIALVALAIALSHGKHTQKLLSEIGPPAADIDDLE